MWANEKCYERTPNRRGQKLTLHFIYLAFDLLTFAEFILMKNTRWKPIFCFTQEPVFSFLSKYPYLSLLYPIWSLCIKSFIVRTVSDLFFTSQTSSTLFGCLHALSHISVFSRERKCSFITFLQNYLGDSLQHILPG